MSAPGEVPGIPCPKAPTHHCHTRHTTRLTHDQDDLSARARSCARPSRSCCRHLACRRSTPSGDQLVSSCWKMASRLCTNLGPSSKWMQCCWLEYIACTDKSSDADAGANRETLRRGQKLCSKEAAAIAAAQRSWSPMAGKVAVAAAVGRNHATTLFELQKQTLSRVGRTDSEWTSETESV